MSAPDNGATKDRSRWHVSSWLALASGSLLIGGLVFLVLYAVSTPGPHLRAIGVGLLTAAACLVAGFLFGFLFGIPRAVSSGVYRYHQEQQAPGSAATGSAATGQPAPATSPQTDAAQPSDRVSFEPSSNLAEVSDWLTKLLLGAGLVSLTKLGQPLGALVTTVAMGMGGPSPTVSAAAKTVAGALLLMYTTLGFLNGYVVTTLWYGRRISTI